MILQRSLRKSYEAGASCFHRAVITAPVQPRASRRNTASTLSAPPLLASALYRTQCVLVSCPRCAALYAIVLLEYPDIWPRSHPLTVCFVFRAGSVQDERLHLLFPWPEAWPKQQPNFSALVLLTYSISPFKKALLKHQNPWTKPCGYKANHNISNFDLKQKSF